MDSTNTQKLKTRRNCFSSERQMATKWQNIEAFRSQNIIRVLIQFCNEIAATNRHHCKYQRLTPLIVHVTMQWIFTTSLFILLALPFKCLIRMYDKLYDLLFERSYTSDPIPIQNTSKSQYIHPSPENYCKIICLIFGPFTTVQSCPCMSIYNKLNRFCMHSVK